jgi:hypothetical protein
MVSQRQNAMVVQVAHRRIIDQLEVAARHRQRHQPRFEQLRGNGRAWPGRTRPGGRSARARRGSSRRTHAAPGRSCRRCCIGGPCGTRRTGGWRDAVADLPAGAVVGLAETGDDERAFAQFGIAQRRFVAARRRTRCVRRPRRTAADVGVAQDRGDARHVRAESIAPDGLCGLLIISMRVRGLIAARTSAQSGANVADPAARAPRVHRPGRSPARSSRSRGRAR